MIALPQSVLFVCTLNCIRSPMAEAMVRQWHSRRIFVRSIGMRAGEVDPIVAEVMGELGIDMSHHKPTPLEMLDDTSFDLVITLSPEAHHTILDLTRTFATDVEYWPTQDPSAVEGSRDQLLLAYRSVRDRLAKRVKDRFPVPPSLAI